MSDRPTFADHSSIEFVLCDLDGVVWLARRAIPGAPEAIARLRASGRRVLFVTNNSVSTIADQEQALAAIGVPAAGDVVTSAQAAASLLGEHDRVLVCGGPGVIEAVTASGAELVSMGAGAPADAVVAGLIVRSSSPRSRRPVPPSGMASGSWRPMTTRRFYSFY